MNWNDYYMEQAGGGDYNTFKGSLYQRGYGMGGMFMRFFRWIGPLLKKAAIPLLKGAATAAGIAKDVTRGKPLHESLKDNADAAIDNLKSKDENALS